MSAMSTPCATEDATSAASCAMAARQKMWRSGWRRYLFPGLWLIYLAQTISGVHEHSHGIAAVVGYLIVLGFAACYIGALPVAWRMPMRRFWWLYGIAFALTVAEVFFAQRDALAFCIYLAVLTVAGRRKWGVVVIVAMTLAVLLLPATLPGWGGQPDWSSALGIVLVSFAMYGFFAIISSNVALAEARSEVARLAAENERTRIARDLHDLLGHSLTTITVKAALARRLAERDPHRAAVEIAEVEQLTRSSLADVRAAVAGYRDVTLAGELATAREVLRAAGITAQLPGAIDVVDPTLIELFGWVLREGITNVVRHARAVHCTVTLGANWIEVLDDGRGSTATAGTGLTGLRERVEARGGSVQAHGGPSGWRLRVDVPLEHTTITPRRSRPTAAGATP